MERRGLLRAARVTGGAFVLACGCAMAIPGPGTTEGIEVAEPVAVTRPNGYVTIFDAQGRWSEVVSPQGETVYLQYEGRETWPARYSTDGMNWTPIRYAPNGDAEQRFRDFADAMSAVRAARLDGRARAQWTEIEPLPPLPSAPVLPELDVYVPYVGSIEGSFQRSGSGFEYFDPSTWDQPLCKTQCDTLFQWSLIGCGFIALMPQPGAKFGALLCGAGERAIKEYCVYTALNC